MVLHDRFHTGVDCDRPGCMRASRGGSLRRRSLADNLGGSAEKARQRGRLRLPYAGVDLEVEAVATVIAEAEGGYPTVGASEVELPRS